MELRTLKYFLAVAREEGINRASDALHITQPTLSRQMALLEDDLGTKLFERGAKKITLTNEGILFRRRAEEILALVEKTEQEILKQDSLVEGKITIGCGELFAVQLLPDLFKAFNQKFPLVTYDLVTGTADIIKDQMEKGLIDIGVILEPMDTEKFDFIRFEKKERWCVLMRADDPLAQKEAITVEDLKSKPLILPRRANVMNELAAWFGDSFKSAKILFTSNLSMNTALMVQAGLGYSLMIGGPAKLLDKNELIGKPLKPDFASNSIFAWKKFKPFSLAATKFIELIKEMFAGNGGG